MKVAQKFLFGVLILVVLASIAATYHKTIIVGDFEVINQENLDQEQYDF